MFLLDMIVVIRWDCMRYLKLISTEVVFVLNVGSCTSMIVRYLGVFCNVFYLTYISWPKMFYSSKWKIELKMELFIFRGQGNNERTRLSIYISVWIDPNRSWILSILKHFSFFFLNAEKKLCLSETIQNNWNDSHTKSIFS